MGESTTWPPWAEDMTRAARCTSRPTYPGGSRRRLAGVEPDPDPDRAAGQAVHRLADRADRGRRWRRRRRTRRPRCRPRSPRVGHTPPARSAGAPPALPCRPDAELLEQPRRALDVGEHQGYRPRRLLDRRHRRIVVQRRRPAQRRSPMVRRRAASRTARARRTARSRRAAGRRRGCPRRRAGRPRPLRHRAPRALPPALSRGLRAPRGADRT